MPLVVKELHYRGLTFPVLIGGAAINRAFGRRALFVEGDRPYTSGVFYCKDAFEGLETMDGLTDPAQGPNLVARNRAEAEEERLGAGSSARTAPPAVIIEKNVRADVAIPTPPFWGTRTLRDIPLDQVFPHLAQRSLFRLSWGAKGVHGEEYVRLLREEFMPRLRRMQREAQEQGYLQPKAVYGYFPANAEGNDVVIFDPINPDRELERFTFARQPAEERLSIADYFAPIDSGRRDVAVLQLVTTGSAATELVDRLQKSGDYSDSYFIHGLSVETAEALAEYVHILWREELGLARNQGKRYSWGYPACPDLSDHEKVMRLLDTPNTVGVCTTAGYQLVPEQSTAAIATHHPDAKYFSVVSRLSPEIEPATA
jgi:5-methyltetrahydrofolate--homocysteine methyltransferase